MSDGRIPQGSVNECGRLVQSGFWPLALLWLPVSTVATAVVRITGGPLANADLGPALLSLVPATSFAEYHPIATIPGKRGRPIKAAAWFRPAGGTEERPPFAFPGFWRQWNWKRQGLRRKTDAELAQANAPILAMVFLTCPANGVVRPIYPKAMPVVLHTDEQLETWLSGSAEEAAALQQPLPDDLLEIAFVGAKADGAG